MTKNTNEINKRKHSGLSFKPGSPQHSHIMREKSQSKLDHLTKQNMNLKEEHKIDFGNAKLFKYQNADIV